MSWSPCAWCGRATEGRLGDDFVMAPGERGPAAVIWRSFGQDVSPAAPERVTVYVHKACFTPHMHLQHAPPEAREAVDALRELLIANHDLQVVSAQSAHREAELARRERDAALAQAASFLPDEAVRADYLEEHGLGWLVGMAKARDTLFRVVARAAERHGDFDDSMCVSCHRSYDEPHDRRCPVLEAAIALQVPEVLEQDVEDAFYRASEHQERLRGLQEVRNTPRGPSAISAGDFANVSFVADRNMRAGEAFVIGTFPANPVRRGDVVGMWHNGVWVDARTPAVDPKEPKE